MTTTIITSLLGPVCEAYYKYVTSQTVQQYDINTYTNYGFSTSFSLNFGFEIYQPLDLNNIQLQAGVYTYQSTYYTYPSNLNQAITFSIQNNGQFILQDLPVSGNGIVTYINKILPLSISVIQSGSSVVGIASNFLTNGIPYDNTINIKDSIIRQFENTYYLQGTSLSILLLVNFANTTITGISTNWNVLKTSLYSYEVLSYRVNNGYGQFYSSQANTYFLQNKVVNLNTKQLSQFYTATYINVYNWINFLTWTPDFLTWFASNKTTLNYFLLKFLSDYFNIT